MAIWKEWMLFLALFIILMVPFLNLFYLSLFSTRPLLNHNHHASFLFLITAFILSLHHPYVSLFWLLVCNKTFLKPYPFFFSWYTPSKRFFIAFVNLFTVIVVYLPYFNLTLSIPVQLLFSVFVVKFATSIGALFPTYIRFHFCIV
jgi:hypothetical protein